MADERKDEFLERLWEAYSRLLTTARRRVSQASIAKAIAEESGMPTRQDDISRWLRGMGRPSYEELPATARALGVRHHWLAFNEGPMAPDEERVYIKPAVLKTPKELEKPTKATRRKGNG